MGILISLAMLIAFFAWILFGYYWRLPLHFLRRQTLGKIHLGLASTIIFTWIYALFPDEAAALVNLPTWIFRTVPFILVCGTSFTLYYVRDTRDTRDWSKYGNSKHASRIEILFFILLVLLAIYSTASLFQEHMGWYRSIIIGLVITWIFQSWIFIEAYMFSDATKQDWVQ